MSVKFWPSEIDISNGKILDGGGGYFLGISEAWNQAESATENESALVQLMIWGIFCAYHKKAIENYQKGIKKVSLIELDLDYLKNRVEESLFNPEADDYSEIRKEYEKE